MSPNLQYICELCFSGKGKYVRNTTHFLDYFSEQGPIWLSCIGVKFGPPWRQQNAMIDWSFKIWKYFTNISQMMTSQVCNVFHNQIHSDQHIHQPTFQQISRSNLVIIKSLPFRTTTMSSHWTSLKTWPIDDREAPRLWWSNFNSQIPWFGSICLPILKGFVCSRGMGLLLSLMIVIFDAKNIVYAEPESINTIWLSQNCEM